MEKFHQPALVKEVIDFLKVGPGKKYIDATVGGGGHAEAILKSGGRILGIDCDPEAIKAAREHFSAACPAPNQNKFGSGLNASWRLVQGNFKNLREIAFRSGWQKVDGILLDLGVSTHQLLTAKRGFSFNLEGPLDMRMDPTLKVTAADLVNGLNKGELETLFSKLGQEHLARRIAEAIVRARSIKPITKCNELADIILSVRPRRGKFDRTHPATRVFLALRIAVNDELNNLREVLPQALELLDFGGRLAVISFHSGEDRIVKKFFKTENQNGRTRIITKKPITPTSAEIAKNPRSRSAKLRVGEKI